MINDILCFFLVTKEAQVEAAEGNQDLPDNSSFGEKNLNAFQKLLTCAIITEQSLPWWWTEIIQYVVIQLIIVKFFLVQ